ncbi:MAG: hypothetical protein P1S46_11260 [bacterium]|nr:hypothetical protein [bacterium]MDT8396654.1 hypothetical protein [bacterium]
MEFDLDADFLGYHSEWNLGSPGGWDYQRITQIIGKEVWSRLVRLKDPGVDLDFDHPRLYPVYGFVQMLVKIHRLREGSNKGLIAVVAEEETLEDVTENINLAKHLSGEDGITGALMAPHELETVAGKVCYRGQPVSVVFMDFNSDVLLRLHRRHDLSPVLQAVREGRVVNPRGTEPINVKSMFELFTGPMSGRFQEETVRRTPWTRRFREGPAVGPGDERIPDLVGWTRDNWDRLVLKPERGYSGMGVRVGGINPDAKEAVGLATEKGNYIVQEKIPLDLWAEDNPAVDNQGLRTVMERYQTDFRCLMGPEGLFGFLVRFGGVPTNVGSGGGVQPLAILRSRMPVREAVDRINGAIMEIPYGDLAEVVAHQEKLSLDHRFTYLLGPIRMALRPRILTQGHLASLERYCHAMWADCLTLEKMWHEGALDDYVDIEEDELAIARSQPWKGGPAVFASDGLFSFGAHPLAG